VISRLMLGCFAFSLMLGVTSAAVAGEACCDKADGAAAADGTVEKAPCGAAAAAADKSDCEHAKGACENCPGPDKCPHAADCPHADCACKKEGAGQGE
jgi:hypothetical protein